MATKIITESGYTYATRTSLEFIDCASCGIVFGAPEEFLDRRRKDGRSFYCPNGHTLSWHETEADRERKARERAERRADNLERNVQWERERAENARRSAIAYKGHLTRIRRRIANGVCPVPGCKRSGFTRVLAHIASQHPDWLHDHPEITDGGEA